MRAALALLSLSILVSAAPAQELVPAPARFACKDGQVVAIQVLVPEPGLVTLYLPPNSCAPASDDVPAAPPPAPPASSRSRAA